MKTDIQVKKRNGRGMEPLDLNKIHLMVDAACKDISGVSASQVEMNAELSLYDGITTADIQETLIRSASDLISLEHPNYQFVAARLLLFALRKSIFHKMWDMPSLMEQIQYGVGIGVYDKAIFDYTDEELDELGTYIDHDRDLKFTYAACVRCMTSISVQDRSSGKIYETPSSCT